MNHHQVFIRMGSRKSPLALAQVDEVLSLLARQGIHPAHERLIFETLGDQDKKRPLTDPTIADNFFTDALDQALLERKIDIAIHSAKDLPQRIPEGLAILALTLPLDETDAFIGKAPLAELPIGARVGTSSILRRQGILEINPNVEIVNIRGTIEERLKLLEEGKCDGIIVATCALKRLKREHQIREILPWETTPLQGQLAIVGRKADPELQKIFSVIDVRRKYGKVFLVGAGPGDPDLITIKAIKILKKADSVFYDYLSHKDLLTYAAQAEKIYVGKRKGEHTLPQEDLCRLLKRKAFEGKTVVRLKGGDPLIFGRGAEEIAYLRAYHIVVQVVPGVSSATGIPSTLGIPLTARNVSSSVAFLSGYGKGECDTSLQPIKIPDADTLVFLMGLTKLGEIVQAVLAVGRKSITPVIIISQGTTREEKVVVGNLENIQEFAQRENLKPPALIIVGEVVNFWKLNSDQSQKNILYLGTNPEKYQSLGRIVHHPMIEISGVDLSRESLKSVLTDLHTYDMMLLTSRWAVHYFFDLLIKNEIDLNDLGECAFAVIGQDTAAALEQQGITPKIVAANETGIGLLQALKNNSDLIGKNIFFPRSSLPNPYLKNELMKLGARVVEFTVYRNTKPQRRDLPSTPIDKVLFTSPSTVKNFLEDYRNIPTNWQILCKGLRTQEALKTAGYSSETLVFD